MRLGSEHPSGQWMPYITPLSHALGRCVNRFRIKMMIHHKFVKLFEIYRTILNDPSFLGRRKT